MMKGYITVFLAMVLSILTGFLLFLTGSAILNGWKVRTELATDLGMNSALGEYQITLYERYGLLYVDTSYEEKAPSLSGLEERLVFYISRNLNQGEKAPFGGMDLKEVQVEAAVSAAADDGRSMKRQAVMYAKDCALEDDAEILAYLSKDEAFRGENLFYAWQSLMAQINEMELPVILNDEGEWEEVVLDNPADGVFSMHDSDILYLAGVDIGGIPIGQIDSGDYISKRNRSEDVRLWAVEIPETDTRTFLVYLYDKFGNYRNVQARSVLQYQLEYVAKGKTSDYENIKAVAKELLLWRFAVNVECIFGDNGLYEEAAGVAGQLLAVQLNPAFREPMIRSILYACAYLEAVGEVKCLLEGGSVPFDKGSASVRIEQVLTKEIPHIKGSSGCSYEQYLARMIYRLPEGVRNNRCMDIMEMDIRNLTGNNWFSMDFCIERFTAQIKANDKIGREYSIRRTYGYY